MLTFLIVGIICLVLAYYSPRFPAPQPITTILYIVGWICVAIALVLLLALLLNLPLNAGSLR